MKTLIITLALGMCVNGAMAQVPTQKKNDMFYDIQSRAPFAARYDTATRTLYNNTTGRQVDFFLNSSGDTISGRGFYIVNNYLQWNNQAYRLDNGRIAWRNEKLWDSRTNMELNRDKNWQSYQQPVRRDSL